MVTSWIIKPVDESDVCGPDLDATDDMDFVDYYYDALNRLPEQYIKPGVRRSNNDDDRGADDVFKVESVNISNENKNIDALLKRSRDIRLLVLKAKWECLAGRFVKSSEAVCAIAELLETFGSAVHPAITSSASERREALSDLAGEVGRHSLTLPLQFIGLVGSTEVTLRKLKLAQKTATPYSFEEEVSLDMLQSALSQPSVRKQVEASHEAALNMAQALERITTLSRTQPNAPFTPEFSGLITVLDEIRGAITAVRPDLRGTEAEYESAEAVSQATSSDKDKDSTGSNAPAVAEMAPQAGAIGSHLQASKALETCEQYFRAHEPSSAAVLLITQARLLIGKSLIEALETLLPEQASHAVVEFGPQAGFALNIDRLRALTNEAAPAAETPAEADFEPVSVSSGADAAALIREVEKFFHLKEKSSAVPVLLRRARSYLDKDFQALVDELMPQKKK